MLSNKGPTSDHPGLSEVAPAARATLPARPRLIFRAPESENELNAGLRAVLDVPAAALEPAIATFRSFASAQAVPMEQLRAAWLEGRIAWAYLPMRLPGRSCLLLCRPRFPLVCEPGEIEAEIESLCREQERLGTCIIQALLPTNQDSSALSDAFLRSGFGELAVLQYLTCRVAGRPVRPVPPRGYRIETYRHELRPLFERAISASYERSLDCPALQGRRRPCDVLEGHMASGHFTPDRWFLLIAEGSGVESEVAGLMLLNGIGPCDEGGIELVYLGTAGSHRGRGIAKFLLRMAFFEAGRLSSRCINLAVDRRNAPALALYTAAGFGRFRERRALARDLVRGEAIGE